MIWLILQGLVFLIWAYASFRALFFMRKRAVQATGRQNPGPLAFARAGAAWLRTAQARPLVWVWLISFAALTALTVALARHGQV